MSLFRGELIISTCAKGFFLYMCAFISRVMARESAAGSMADKITPLRASHGSSAAENESRPYLC